MQTAGRLRLYGIIQGVGFRPFVSKLARDMGVAGEVINRGSLVDITAYAPPAVLTAFFYKIKTSPPPRAIIAHVEAGAIIMPDNPPTDFTILDSEIIDLGISYLSADIGICDNCGQELRNPNDRRYLHPFINCTDCGPRLTIINQLPYDRERTIMAKFPLCNDCSAEYYDIDTRRYDAQPIACPHCGPHYYILSPNSSKTVKDNEAITLARQAIAGGKIVAIKGIGGFHLVCDAGNQEVVARLRQRKYRPQKPLAVMVKNMSVAGREVALSPVAKDLLSSWQRPIVLLPKRNIDFDLNADIANNEIITGLAVTMPSDTVTANRLSPLTRLNTPKIADNVAPNTYKLGIMLPYAPVHHLLFDYPDDIAVSDVLVMTSGNPAGLPICITDEDALAYLSEIADLILSHDRDILIRADDSVMTVYRDKPYMIRRSRGYAPLPLSLILPDADATNPDINTVKQDLLAIGADQKNTFALMTMPPDFPALIYPSPHVGNLGDIRSHEALLNSICHLKQVLKINPQKIIADMHPRYYSRQLAEEQGLPVAYVQHHHAHILACMAENNYLSPVIGIALDGTGYGYDSTIWGGEILYVTPDGCERVACLNPFYQLGGDKSARDGWRIALSLIYQLTESKEQYLEWTQRLELATENIALNSYALLDNQQGGIISTSAGRLFDGVSAILGICAKSTYEGEAAVQLENMAYSYLSDNKLNLTEIRLNTPINNSMDIVSLIIKDYLAGEAKAKLACHFHILLANLLSEMAIRSAKERSLTTVALSGGVLQNILLLDLLVSRLEDAGLQVLYHSLIPTSDGGIALGQAVYGGMSVIKKLPIYPSPAQ